VYCLDWDELSNRLKEWMEPRVLFKHSAPPNFVAYKERRNHMERYFRVANNRLADQGHDSVDYLECDYYFTVSSEQYTNFSLSTGLHWSNESHVEVKTSAIVSWLR